MEVLNRGKAVHDETAYQQEVIRLMRKKGEDHRLDKWESEKLNFYESAGISAEVLVDVIIDHRNVLW